MVGRTSLLPRKLVPGETVSRLVPSASIVASSLAWLEADTPTTATIAPIPIAIPSADSAARSLPGPQTLQRDAEQFARWQPRRFDTRAARQRRGRARSRALVSDDLAVAHLDPTLE